MAGCQKAGARGRRDQIRASLLGEPSWLRGMEAKFQTPEGKQFAPASCPQEGPSGKGMKEPSPERDSAAPATQAS
ncbi:hypothetical protein D3C87_1103150 [compost metagenome]